MENFFYSDNFYSDLGELIDYLDIEEDVDNIEDGWSIMVEETQLEPMFKVSADDFAEMLFNKHDERYSEECAEEAKIINALKLCIDFEKLNSLIPKMHYMNGKKVKITKADLLEYIK